MSLDVELTLPGGQEVFRANITHNLGSMANEAGIYDHVWCPEAIGVTKAVQLIEPLEAGIALMKSDLARFQKHDSPNGWGSYKVFVPWLEEYLAACRANPEAAVSANR